MWDTTTVKIDISTLLYGKTTVVLENIQYQRLKMTIELNTLTVKFYPMIDIIAEDLGENSPPVSGIELEIAYDFQKLDVFNSAPIIKGELINNYPGMDLLIDELGEGSITITIVVTEGFNSFGLTGTGILFSI
jgi:hypothetical protein